MQSLKQLEGLTRQNGNEQDFVIELLNKAKIPLTKENYLGLAYPDGVPEDFDDSTIPEQIRKK